MTGIAGCLALAAGTRPDPEWARRAAWRTAHRGPDDDGVFADGAVALSARRLAIIDPSPGGRQPMRSADGRFWMVFDGAIYNYPELAGELRSRGVSVSGASDAEVLLAAYALDGKDVLRQLRGMYAFAIWDARNGELFCARDPFGQKPFFYTVTDGGQQLRFSSERIGLTLPGEASDLDPDALRRYLSFQYVPAPATMTPPVRALPPGHFLLARPGAKVDVFRYWRPVLRPARSPSAQTPEKILDALRDSVTAHLRADVPVGSFLSGGVDSAAICALAAETRPGMVTFTAGFDVDGYNEIPWAQETATALGLKNVACVITPQEFVNRLPQILWHLGDPLADAAAVPLWFVAREARKHVRVVLSGEGADELFGGYGVYHQPAAVRAAAALPGLARSSAGAIAARMTAGKRGKGLLQRVATPLRDRYIGNANVFSLHDVDALTRYGEGTVYEVTDPLFDQAAEAELDDVATMQLVDINTWLPGDILAKADRMSEARLPGAARALVPRRARGVPRACAARRADRRMAGQACRAGRGTAVQAWRPGRVMAADLVAGRLLALAPDLRGARVRPREARLGRRSRRRRRPAWPAASRAASGLSACRTTAGSPARRDKRAAPHVQAARITASGAVGVRRGRQHAAGRQLLADLAAAPVQPGHHGADRRPHDLGDLPVRVALDVGEVDRGAEFVGQAAQRAQQG
jgi:asparagine synthase (glutamine-hydrolysing)